MVNTAGGIEERKTELVLGQNVRIDERAYIFLNGRLRALVTN
jgi:hypothetical protein